MNTLNKEIERETDSTTDYECFERLEEIKTNCSDFINNYFIYNISLQNS